MKTDTPRRPRMALNDVKARNAKPGDKRIKLADGDGIHVYWPPYPLL